VLGGGSQGGGLPPFFLRTKLRRSLTIRLHTCRKHLCHTRKFFLPKVTRHSHRIQRTGRRLREPRDFGFSIAGYRIAGLPQACEPSASEGGNLWGFPDQPSSPPTPCIPSSPFEYQTSPSGDFGPTTMLHRWQCRIAIRRWIVY